MKKPKSGMHCWSYLAIPLQVSDSSVFLLKEFCCPGGGDRDWAFEIQAGADVNLGVRAADPKDSMWVVVKIMGPFWIPVIIRHPKRDHNFDNHPCVQGATTVAIHPAWRFMLGSTLERRHFASLLRLSNLQSHSYV